MAKPKAPRWLTEAFAWGVDELVPPLAVQHGAYPGAWAHCFLAHHDPARRPCSGERGYERFHFIPRQRVENALWALLNGAEVVEREWIDGEYWVTHSSLIGDYLWDLILLAAWDPRNGGLGCEHHHRRFDSHAVSPREPNIVVPVLALPDHVHDFIGDYGLESPADQRFPGYYVERGIRP